MLHDVPMQPPAPVPKIVIQQLVDAFEALGAQGWISDEKVSPSIFKGIPGEKPGSHFLNTND